MRTPSMLTFEEVASWMKLVTPAADIDGPIRNFGLPKCSHEGLLSCSKDMQKPKGLHFKGSQKAKQQR